jgi:hypothetical protein
VQQDDAISDFTVRGTCSNALNSCVEISSYYEAFHTAIISAGSSIANIRPTIVRCNCL